MEDWGTLTIVWSGAILVLVLIVGISRRARRHGGSLRAGIVGAMYEWQDRDRQKALEIIVDGKAAARDPEHRDGNLPELEGIKRDASTAHTRSGAESELRASVFIGVSLDGFIARPNGDLDWLPEGGGEPHGYDEFIASVDAIVIGRGTFEKVLSFGAWPYGDKRVVVLSSRPVDLSAAKGAVVEQMAGPPAEIAARLAASGVHHVYVDGGITIQGFLRAGLIQRLIITHVPVLIGQGIPLFGALPADVRLGHVATQHFPSGLVQSEYHVIA